MNLWMDFHQRKMGKMCCLIQIRETRRLDIGFCLFFGPEDQSLKRYSYFLLSINRRMGCEESRLMTVHNQIALSVIDPSFLKPCNQRLRQALEKHNIQTHTYMSIECFINELSNNYSNHLVVRQQDLPSLMNYLKSINSNPYLFVLENKSTQKPSHSRVIYLPSYEELLQQILKKRDSVQLEQQKECKIVDMKILKDFKSEAESQLFIFEETLKIKNISYQVFGSFGQLEQSMKTSSCKFVVTDYRFHHEVINLVDQKLTKVICFCDLDDREEYNSQLYFITNNFQQIANEVATCKSFKLPPLPTTKIFLYSSDQNFCRYAQVFMNFQLNARFYQNLSDLLRATKLYFSLIVICPEQEKSLLEKQLLAEGCTHRVKIIGLEEETEASSRGLRKVIREVKRGYLIEKSQTKVVDIIDKYHNSAKFEEIKNELRKNGIGFRCYNDLINYTKTLNYLAPFIICNFSEKNLLVRYLEEVQSRSRIIVFCNKAKITDQLLHENKWAFISSNFGKIIKFIRANPVIVPVILDHNQQRIQQKQEKIKNKQHRISALQWASPTSNSLPSMEDPLMKEPELSFLTVKQDINNLSLKEISHDATSLLKLTNKPISNLTQFKEDLLVSLQFLKTHYKIEYPESSFNQLLEGVKTLNIQLLATRVRQFLGNQKDMGLKINESLRNIEKLQEKELKHLKQVIFLMNMNFISFYSMPKISSAKLVHWTRETQLDQCKVDSIIIAKNFFIMYEEGTVEPIPGCLKIEINFEYNTITDSNPYYNSFFCFNQRYVFSPYTHFRLLSIQKENAVTVIQLEVVKESDFLVYYFDENIGKNPPDIYTKDAESGSNCLVDPAHKQQVIKNIQRCAILKQFRVGNFDKAIKMQKDLIKKEQETQNFDSKYLIELQFELANYYLKQGSPDQVLAVLKQITENNPNSYVKRECSSILQKLKNVIDKQQKSGEIATKKERTQKCIELKEEIDRSDTDSEMSFHASSDKVLGQNELQCLQIDQHECLAEQFA